MIELSQLDEMIKRALSEDIGTGDITSEATIPAELTGEATLKAKDNGVVCGLPVAQRVFALVDSRIVFEPLVKEGERINRGQLIARVTGPARGLLMAERVALNFVQRLSGIATRTQAMVELIRYYNARITDTRKTTPGLRLLEKYAVRIGGGSNHRFGLYDAVLIKDNHIAVAGGIKSAVAAARQRAGHTVKVEVEVETLEQVTEALESGADIIMLDNMAPETMRKSVEMIGDRAITEASGGITEANIAEVAKTGVDYISLGCLTHSIKALDISMNITTSPKAVSTATI
ncbi:MAG: carboxylating nicotinate-nucleotide diphosphorylase [Bacillota bacterium]